jgi:cellulose synthase/poly-beta-1,6-N-acetylglucosamine synthase-like glycosyltransferase
LAPNSLLTLLRSSYLAVMLLPALFFTALLLFYAGYLFYCSIHWTRLTPQNPQPTAFPKVSVIIPARNEALHITTCIRAVLNQNYPQDKMELIVINDHSEDNTVTLAQKAAQGHPNFRLLHLETQMGVAYKKAAVARGIQEATGEIVVTTDADCQMGTEWLRTLVGTFDAETGLVSGPVLLEGTGIFAEFQALEFMGLIAVGAASIAAGHPTMCNGANLAYRRAAFDAVGGFAGIDHIASGDDELLMHKIAASGQYKIRFAKSRSAIVHTPAQSTWTQFKQQRIRWVSKSRHYKRQAITLILVASYLAMLGFPLLLIGGFWDHRLWWLLLGHLAIKLLAEAAVLVPAAAFFDKLRLLRWLPAEQAAHIVYVLWVGIAGNRKSYHWKGRNVQ